MDQYKEKCSYCVRGSYVFNAEIDGVGKDKFKLEVSINRSIDANLRMNMVPDVLTPAARFETHVPINFCPFCGRKLSK